MQRTLSLIAAIVFIGAPTAAPAQASRPVVAIFAHADDERVVAPLLAKLAREGRATHLVVATDGAKGVRDYYKVPAGPELAAARALEAKCAAARLGVRQLYLLGFADAGLASFDALGRMRAAIRTLIDSLHPAAIITFGPEGGTGHPDHRLVGDVTSEIVQGDARYADIDLLYASLPAERLRTAPAAKPGVTGMAASLLTVRVPFAPSDLTAQREAYACHKSQYLPAEMDAVNAYLAHAWDGQVWLRPFDGVLRNSRRFTP